MSFCSSRRGEHDALFFWFLRCVIFELWRSKVSENVVVVEVCQLFSQATSWVVWGLIRRSLSSSLWICLIFSEILILKKVITHFLKKDDIFSHFFTFLSIFLNCSCILFCLHFVRLDETNKMSPHSYFSMPSSSSYDAQNLQSSEKSAFFQTFLSTFADCALRCCSTVRHWSSADCYNSCVTKINNYIFILC